ncbi:MAG TPA: cation:proton antiporter [Methanothrix sp.]|nr:cation:proton antiporter [Methanothrix sp.]HUM80992.1 cation:proton antiporter [Methanothrix sp.]
MATELELLNSIVIVISLSVVVLFIFHRLRAPTIVGFLLTGILAGPQGLGLISASEQVSLLADIGVVLLLFTVGIEVSLRDIIQLKKYVLVGGSLQVALTTLAVFLVMMSLDLPVGTAVLLGLLVSLSSTAIVLRIIQKREEFDSLHGRTTLGILIFQDMAVVPMMLLIPLLPGSTLALGSSPLAVALKGLSIVALIIISAKWLVPRILYSIARTRDRELFLLSIVAICLAVAWITSLAGLSLGLGAFLAGLIISESPYSHQAFGNIVPLRDVFTSFFFISIGMLLDVGVLIANPAFIVLLALAVMALKAALAGLAISLMGLPFRIIILVSLALSQIGEFSFVLSKVGFESGLISREYYQIFLDVTVLTLAATSLIMAVSPKVAEGMLRLPLPSRLKARPYPSVSKELEALEDHLIIIGYGVNGRNVARSAKRESIPYLIVDMDPEIVMREGKSGEPIYFGDAASEAVLNHVGICKAKAMVIAISDPSATRRITELARRLNPDIFIIARTRYVQEMKPLHDLGADEVIPEEYETSIEIFSRVLSRYDVPRDKIESFIDQIRSDGYDMFRSYSREPFCSADLSLMTEDISTLKVCQGSPASERALGELELEALDIKPLAVHRGMDTLSNPDKGLVLLTDDVVILMGREENIHKVADLFRSETP